jgi:NADH-quinone oxidoreductase subunit F
VDIHTSGRLPCDAERDSVDRVLATVEEEDGQTHGLVPGRVSMGGLSFSSRRRHLLLPVLWSIQEASGWISPEALDYACTRLGVAPADAYGVASAYALLSMLPSPAAVLHVCDDIACRAAAAGDPCREVEMRLGTEGEPREGIAWHRSPCLGQCERGSAAMIQVSGANAGRVSLAPASPDALAPIWNGVDNSCLQHATDFVAASLSTSDRPAPTPLVPQLAEDRSRLRLLRRVGLVDPDSIDSYRAQGGFQALRRAVSLGPDLVLREVTDAKLLGRGGAAFPTGTKWQAVASNPARPHYFVCNADESEPGTFKDRIIIENDPFALVEALTIAGFATGSERGYIYIRGEYPLAERRLWHAILEARNRGLLGPDVTGSGFSFDIEVRRGAGAYIAGEETALFNSIEGKRPEPRNKPPYPTQVGLFGKPTGVNNVETLLNVLDIVMTGSRTFAQIGTKDSTGTRLFCLSGSVQRPGLYEAPMGLTLRDLLMMAGGLPPGRELRAILLGGAAGIFVGPDQLEITLSFEGARAAGVTLGSGVVMVFDTHANLSKVVRRMARFFRDESCGQCVPCRVGTVRQEELVARLAASQPLGSVERELELLGDLAAVMKDASICGLGQTATGAIESAIKLGLFPEGLGVPGSSRKAVL